MKNKHGTVKWWSQFGYGWVQEDKTKYTWFLYWSSIINIQKDHIKVGIIVEFRPNLFIGDVVLYGTVQSYSESRKYGFINSDVDNLRIFVHKDQLLNCYKLVRGRRVSFYPIPDPTKDKLMASDVYLL